MERGRFFLNIILCSSLLVGVPFLAMGGSGDSGGGGSTIICGKQKNPYLLDRLSLKPELADSPEVVSEKPVTPSIPANRQPEIGGLFESDQAAFNLAIKNLKRAEARIPNKDGLSKALVNILIDTLRGTSYKRTTHAFNVISRYSLEPNLQKKCTRIETAILHLPLYGCIISGPAWDKLDLETQAGLMVHEAIRQLQEAHGIKDLSDEQLQKITAAIVLDQQGYDLSQWMSPKLRTLCAVSSGANDGCSGCNTKQNLNKDVLDRLMAKVAISLTKELNSTLDQNQKEKAQALVENSSQLQRLLNDLVHRGILKR